MKYAKSSKHLTFVYFSIVAIAIIAIHVLIFVQTLDELEWQHAENKLIYTRQEAHRLLPDSDTGVVTIPPYSHAYIGKSKLPDILQIPADTSYDEVFEIQTDGSEGPQYFVMKVLLSINGEMQDVYLVNFDEIYEQSEEQVMGQLGNLWLLSLALLIFSLFVVLRITNRLTGPLIQLTESLNRRIPQKGESIAVPDIGATREIQLLVDSFNQYDAQIRGLIERERSFTRYASHELRSPLTVMKGSITLLGQSDDPAFIEKQRIRLLQACNELSDFSTTLLSLTRDEDISTRSTRPITAEEINGIVTTHRHLIEQKSVECRIEVVETTFVKAPEATVKILIGNLLKNAFAATHEGQVSIIVSPREIRVIDSGTGLHTQNVKASGYGLGLLIVKDICSKYGWTFNIAEGATGGCTATIILQPDIRRTNDSDDHSGKETLTDTSKD